MSKTIQPPTFKQAMQNWRDTISNHLENGEFYKAESGARACKRQVGQWAALMEQDRFNELPDWIIDNKVLYPELRMMEHEFFALEIKAEREAA